MTARAILKNFAIFVDGRGYAGEALSYSPPALALTTEGLRASGMDAEVAIDMGMEAMEATFSFANLPAEIFTRFGLSEGNSTQLTARGAVEDGDGTVHAEVHHCRGKITRVGPGAWEPGQRPALEVTMSLIYFRQQRDNRELVEVDVPNMTRVIDGVDQLAARRQAMGI